MAAAVRAGDHSSAQAAPVLRASRASSSLRSRRIAPAISHRDLPLALQVSVSRPRGGYPCLPRGPGALCASRGPRTLAYAGGQPQPQAPKASTSPEAPQLGIPEARMAESVPSAVRVGAGTGVTVRAHRPPSLPAAAGESGFLVHAFPSAPLSAPRGSSSSPMPAPPGRLAGNGSRGRED